MTQLQKLEQRIVYDNRRFDSVEAYTTQLTTLLDDAKHLCLSLLYPFLDDDTDIDELELPKKYYNWQIRASVEIFKWQDNQGIASYSENGLSYTKLQDGVLSVELMNEVIPKVGVPKGAHESGLSNATYLVTEESNNVITENEG